MNAWIVALIIFVLTLPFGYWRAAVRKLCLQWFLAIHLPVLIVIAMRFISGLWQWYTYPLFIGAFFLGHFLAARLYHWWKRHAKAKVTACLVWNVVKELQLRTKK
ncbi:MAG: hypothetical protein HN929_03965 [Chloroflexi bacterium]|jgi:hypothetical protein|nr:hypothetical protein [Chloroflexota bacterium]MBT7080611.1 hypothetical protein [Chloroflexota bacterium]MBT7289252.1 hypothetical protein [Chloroflexota bacterium]